MLVLVKKYALVMPRYSSACGYADTPLEGWGVQETPKDSPSLELEASGPFREGHLQRAVNSMELLSLLAISMSKFRHLEQKTHSMRRESH